MNKSILQLKEKLKEIVLINSALALSTWDSQVNLPPKGVPIRAEVESYLAGQVHKKLLALNEKGLLNKLNSAEIFKTLNSKDQVIVRETCREFKKARKLSQAFVEQLARTSAEAIAAWEKAREAKDFKILRPHLETLVSLKREQAKQIGFKKTPYDALLDDFEPGMTAENLTAIFEELKLFLIPKIAGLTAKKDDNKKVQLKKNLPLEKQKEFNQFIAKKLGFDFEAGRLDISAHPFTNSGSPKDVRITTRYRQDDFTYSLLSTIHEAGHGLYEQGLPTEHFGNPLSESVSFGIHESQSMLWEKMVGKSETFWKFAFPLLNKFFDGAFKNNSYKEMYKAVNIVQPNLIRTESDELTYLLHIILRFEIEKDLIEGTLEVKNLPEVWKQKIKDYLGLDVPNDSLGVMQDIHWASGAFGYFPSYALGNIYAAQFFDAAKREIKDLDEKIKKGNFDDLLNWLRKSIHSKGKTYNAQELLKKVTGNELSITPLVEYFNKKFKILKS